MEFHKIIVAGKIVGGPKTTKTKSGMDVTYFSVVITEARNDLFFPVAVYGEKGKKLAKGITDSRPVVVDGRYAADRYGLIADNVYLDVQG